MRRGWGLWAGVALACADPELPEVDESEGPLGAPQGLAQAPMVSPCPGSNRDFAARAIRLIQGRRASGVAELIVLAQMVEQLDARGFVGRAIVARGLASGPRYHQRWRGALLDLSRVPRTGATADRDCYGSPGALALGAELAVFVRDHGPEAAPPAALGGWSMADLLGSSLHLDDLRPWLRAHTIYRVASPVVGNNVSPVELERARRDALGRGFEAAYLGRRVECVGCHHGSGGTALDADDPALDRTWPVVPGLEAMVYGPAHLVETRSAYAAQRVDGFVGGGWRPWGASSRCGGFERELGVDVLEDAGYFAGALPAGASALELEARLRAGFEGLGGALERARQTERPEIALAALVAIHLADEAWREATGAPLTMPHGQPRGQLQAAILGDLARRLVAEGFSLRELLVAVAVHPLLDLAEPSACAADLPPIFDPLLFLKENHSGHLVRPEGAWVLMDSAALAMGWALEDPLPPTPTWGPLLRSLGVFLDEVEPGHRGDDVIAALAWEAAIGDGQDPGWGREGAEGADFVARLVEVARADPPEGAALWRVEDAVIALHDRILQDPGPLTAELQGAAEALLGAPLAAVAREVEAELLRAGLRRYAGALLSSPTFTLAGLPPPAGEASPPRLTPPELRARALCEALAPQILGALAVGWSCDEAGVQVEP